MNDLNQYGTTETEIESLSRSRQNLTYVRQELLEYRPDIVDDDLRAWVTRFLMDSTDLPPSSAREHISQTLHEINERHAMFREPGMTNAEDAFPDRCKDCQHYGSRCPVLTENRTIKRRKRIFRETSDPSELRRRLREYSIDHGCHVIKDAIDELTEEHEPMLAEGQLLLMLVEETLYYGDEHAELIRTLTNRVQQLQADRLEDLDDEADGSVDGEAPDAPQEPSTAPDDAGIAAADEPVEADGGVHEGVTGDGA